MEILGWLFLALLGALAVWALVDTGKRFDRAMRGKDDGE